MIMLAFDFIGDLVSALSTALTWLFTTFQSFSQSLVNGMFTAFGSAVPSFDPSPYIADFDNLNYFIPLSETITYALAWFALWTAIFGYRLVKSWLPTLGS